MTFKAGDIVRLRQDWRGIIPRNFNYEGYCGFDARAVLVSVSSSNLRLRWHKDYPCPPGLRGHHDPFSLVQSWGAIIQLFEHDVPDLDLSRPLTTRGGYPVRVITLNGACPERPLEAVVKLPDRERLLTYLPTGYFYKRIEQPLDLVNA